MTVKRIISTFIASFAMAMMLSVPSLAATAPTILSDTTVTLPLGGTTEGYDDEVGFGDENSCKTQSIYYASEIGGKGTIEAIEFELKEGAKLEASSLSVYLMMIPASTTDTPNNFASETALIGDNNRTKKLVYSYVGQNSETITFDASKNTKAKIEFSEPYEYDGVSDLVLMITDYRETWNNYTAANIKIKNYNTAVSLIYNLSNGGWTSVQKRNKEPICKFYFKDVDGISLLPSYADLYPGDTKDFSYTITTGKDLPVTFSSEDSSIATVDSNGKVTAVSPGSTKIHATLGNGNSDYANITVYPIHCSSVTLNKTSETLYKNNTLTLTATMDTTHSKDTITWSSSDETVATVDETGKVTAKKSGTAIITAKANDSVNATCEIKVITPIEVGFNAERIVAGKTVSLDAKVGDDLPYNYEGYKLTYSTSSLYSNVVSVNSYGRVTAKSAGTAYITIAIFKGNAYTAFYSTRVKVNVVDSIPAEYVLFDTYKITKKSTVKLEPYLEPVDTTDKTGSLKWSSSDEKIATVDVCGNVTAKAEGDVVITATLPNGVYGEAKVHVYPVHSTSISLPNVVEVRIGNYGTVATVTTVPAKATDDYKWSSSDESIVTVESNGVLTGIKAGEATLTAEDESGNKASCRVKVTGHPYYIDFYPEAYGMGYTVGYEYTREEALAANQFTKEGYVFTGWNTKADGTGDSYKDKEVVSNLCETSGGRVSLYAQWKELKWKVSFDANGGIGRMYSEEYLHDGYDSLAQCEFERDGYTFTGWNTKADGTGTSYEPGKNPGDLAEESCDIVLYAQWKSDKVVTEVAKPKMPTLSSVKAATTGQTVTWKKVSGVTGYYVYRSTNGVNFKKIATVKGASTVKYTDKAAKTNGTKYTYKVTSYLENGAEVLESDSSATKFNYTLTKPAVSSLKNSAAKTATVTWKKNSKATGYEIQYSTSSKFTGAKKVTVTKNSTVSTKLKSLTKKKTYYVRIRSYKKVGKTYYYSNWSATSKVTIKK